MRGLAPHVAYMLTIRSQIGHSRSRMLFQQLSSNSRNRRVNRCSAEAGGSVTFFSVPTAAHVPVFSPANVGTKRCDADFEISCCTRSST